MSAFQVNGSPRAYIASSLRERTSTVHPHACGEHIVSSSTRTRSFGSSPRMWGTRPLVAPRPHRRRFIPTHVGNTRAESVAASPDTVHPHACGEHMSMRAKIFRYGGSSPRMWGTLGIRDYVLQRLRFIPTHVGNTSLVRTPRSIPTVHPHACGEHRVGRRRLHPATGSSPRMWGTRCARQCRGVGERFIPTHVGNTTSPVCGSCVWTVHPHACGEHAGPFSPARRRYGSSPRMWGTRGQWVPHPTTWRFIPTHVGNTLTVQHCF